MLGVVYTGLAGGKRAKAIGVDSRERRARVGTMSARARQVRFNGLLVASRFEVVEANDGIEALA